MPKHITRRRRMSKKKGGDAPPSAAVLPPPRGPAPPPPIQSEQIYVVIFRQEDEDDDFRLFFDSTQAINVALPQLLSEYRLHEYMEAIERSGKTVAEVVNHLATRNAVPLRLGNGYEVVRATVTMYGA